MKLLFVHPSVELYGADKILLYIFKDKYDISSTKKLVVSTIEDLDLVIKWFKAFKYNESKSEKEKLRKELFKKLKEIKWF